MQALLADIIMHICTSLHSKFQIRYWLKLRSACILTNLRTAADVNLSQSRIWNLEWSEVQKCTIISANVLGVQSCQVANIRIANIWTPLHRVAINKFLITL